MSRKTLFYFFLFFICIGQIRGITQVANFPQIANLIKTGDHKAIMSRLSSNSNTLRTQNYNRTFSSVPRIALGIMIFEIQSGQNMAFSVDVISVTTTSFQSNITTKMDTSINQLYYTYIAIDSSGFFGLFPLVVWNTLVTNNNSTLTFPIGSTININHQIVVSTFIRDFEAARFNNDISLKVDTKIISATDFQVKVSTNSTISRVNIYVFWVDRTVLQQNYLYFIDSGYGITEYQISSYTNFVINPSSFNYFNFLRGPDWLSFNASSSNSLFSVRFDQFPFPSVSSYKIARLNLLHWRQRQCTTPTYYYLEAETKCYDTCPSGYANNSVQRFCQKCDYKCLQCAADGSTCNSCPLNSNRLLSNGTCTCGLGYFQQANSTAICGSCHYSCTTCVTSSEKCLSCDPTRDYNNSTFTCLCKFGMFDTQNNTAVCSLCHYTCLTCTSSATTCLSCNASSHRVLAISSCLCSTGFQEPSNSSQDCVSSVIVCSQNCFTCQTSANYCTSCDANKKRVISSLNTCICKTGYQSGDQISTCQQICGDGKRFQLACDDGNVVDGDGCSSTCSIQNNFLCNTGVEPNICVYKFSYNIILQSVAKRIDSNVLDLVFNINPFPPSGSVASLSSLPLKIISQSLSKGVLSIVAEYNQSIPLGSFAKLSLSTIPNNLNFQVKSDDGLSINYYLTQNYTARNVQAALVWVFVAFFWFFLLAFIIFYHNKLLQVLQFVISIAMIWIGAAGLPKIGIYYQPLLYLQYIYGYNATINNQDGLFAFINYGLLFLLVPIFVILVASIIQKCKISYGFNQLTKKYVTIQLTYSLLCYYSVGIIYGLTTESLSKTYSTPLSIGSIIFGIIYLIFLLLSCIFFFMKPFNFTNLRKSMMGKKGPNFFIFMALSYKLIIVLVYMLVSIHTRTKYSSLIVVGLQVIAIVITVCVKPYQNSLRVIMNQVIVICCFLCYYLTLQVQNAEWAGFLVLALAYFGLLGNYGVLSVQYCRESRIKKLQNQASEDSSVDHQVQQNSNKIDLDFDPHKIMNSMRQSRMETVKKQPIESVYAVPGETIRKKMIQQFQ